jgi:hypothetical protein
MDYACSVCRAVVLTCVRTLKVFQSERLRIASDAPWYVGGMHICEDLGVQHFIDHIRALTESILTGVSKLLFR